MDLVGHKAVLAVICIMNAVAFIVYWYDKQAARVSARRIRESTLLWLAAAGGSVGALAAGRLFRHKTRKEPFRTILMSIFIAQAGLVLLLVFADFWQYQIPGP